MVKKVFMTIKGVGKPIERKCPICGRWIKSLGWASHRAKHYRERLNG